MAESKNPRSDYGAEGEAGQWQVEREGNPDLKAELKSADQEAEKMENYRDRQDPEYNPENPQEERAEAEHRGDVEGPTAKE